MKFTSHFLIPLITLASLNAYAEGKNIELTSSADIQDAMKMQKAYEPLFNKVAECFDKKLAQNGIECYCIYPTEVSQARKVYETTLTLHPNWRDQGIYWYSEDKKSYQLSFYGLRHRFEQKCPTHPSVGR